MNNSRTAKSIKNSVLSILFSIINLVVQFIARRIFLEYLGADILGLNTTAQNILQFLNLAELGIGTAVGYFLYKPLREKDEHTINEIVTLQGHLYRRIATIIIIGATIVMPFFPFIFQKISLPLWYAYVSFAVYLFGSLLSYFVNYRQIVLSANQQNYKILYSYQSVMITSYLVQILVLSKFSYPFESWAIVNIVFTILGSVSLHWMTKKTFPFLKNTKDSFKQLKCKYPDFTIKIKQLFFHKIGSFVLGQSSSLIIYAYATLSLVTYYGNYMMIITGVKVLITSLFNSVDAGIGNLVAEGDENKILSVFKEMFSLRFVISILLSFMVFQMTPSFITLWIGKQFLLPASTLWLMVGILYIGLLRYSVDNFINAYGLFSDIYAPVVEAGLNIGLSILLGYFFGLNGILTGVLISLIIVIGCWKPYFLFRNGLKVNLIFYLKLYVHHIIIGGVTWLLSLFIIERIQLNCNSNIIKFIISAFLSFIIFSIIICGLLIITKGGIEKTFKRILNNLMLK